MTAMKAMKPFPWATLMLLLATLVSHATLPEPDNVVYGTIYIDTNLVTAGMSYVVVRAERLTGEILASYQMGENPDLGDRYSLSIPLESIDFGSNLFPGLLNEEASVTGDSIAIVVIDIRSGVDLYESNYVVGTRAQISELNFGTGQTGGSSGYEIWSNFHGLQPGNRFADTDGDGVDDNGEYEAGTDPNDPADKFLLEISGVSDTIEIQWLGRLASGPGYEGLTRVYSLDQSSSLTGEDWTGIAGWTNLVGNGQVFIYTPNPTNTAPFFYRARVRLIE